MLFLLFFLGGGGVRGSSRDTLPPIMEADGVLEGHVPFGEKPLLALLAKAYPLIHMEFSQESPGLDSMATWTRGYPLLAGLYL